MRYGLFRKLLSRSYCAAGVSTALRMCYRGYGYPLTLFLEEGGVVTVCKINTQEPEEPIDFDFCSANVTNKVDLKYFITISKTNSELS